MEYKKPLAVKHTVENITSVMLKFIEEVKPKLKGIELKLPGDFPHHSIDSDEYSYCIYNHYLNTHSNKDKHGSTGMFPIYYNEKDSHFIILNHKANFMEDIKIGNIFVVLKEIEDYFLSCSFK